MSYPPPESRKYGHIDNIFLRKRKPQLNAALVSTEPVVKGGGLKWKMKGVGAVEELCQDLAPEAACRCRGGRRLPDVFVKFRRICASSPAGCCLGRLETRVAYEPVTQPEIEAVCGVKVGMKTY
jgi:hypothetical protein